MSAKVFALITAKPGKDREVVAALKGLEGVTTADAVTGPYDVIAVVEGERFDEICKLVTREIQPVPDISGIVICLSTK